LRKYLKLDSRQSFDYLDRVLKVSPYNEGVWLELAGQVKAEEVGAKERPGVLGHLATLMRIYEKYPDFVWKVAPDLLQIQPDQAARTRTYEQIVLAFEKKQRPDLACEARLKWLEYPEESKQYAAAAKGLTQTMLKFPEEGRYVPKLWEKLEEISGKYRGGKEATAKFLLEFLPKVPPRRGSEPNRYAIQMYEKAVVFLKEAKKDKDAAAVERQLELVRSGRR